MSIRLKNNLRALIWAPVHDEDFLREPEICFAIEKKYTGVDVPAEIELSLTARQATSMAKALLLAVLQYHRHLKG